MKLRTRLAVFIAATAAIAVIAVAISAWFVARSQMRASVDDQLFERAEVVAVLADPASRRERRPGFLPGGAIEQRFRENGVVISAGEIEIPVSEADIAVARGGAPHALRDETIDGLHLRVLTVSVAGPSRVAVTFATPLTQVDQSLDRLRGALVLLSAVGILGAAGAGLIVAGRSVRPIVRLTNAAEHVAATQDLTSEIDVERTDELGRLAESFNKMLRALSRSRTQQHQLVTDASHELRTPLTSLRTNLETLHRAGSDADDIREQVTDDVLFELDELTLLVTELVELATDRHEAGDYEPVDLAEPTSAVVTRHQRRTSIDIELVREPSLVLGVRPLLERAISNLVDNAVKFTPEGGVVRVVVSPGRVEVSDSGPGVATADQERVFDRFWRADAAKSLSGSGLGLAIVKQVAEAHGGTVRIADGGSATFVLTLPVLDHDD